MATRSGERAAYFPAIEKKHGQPMAHWFDLMSERAEQSFGEQFVTWTPCSLSVQVASVCRSCRSRQVAATSAGVRQASPE